MGIWVCPSCLALIKKKICFILQVSSHRSWCLSYLLQSFGKTHRAMMKARDTHIAKARKLSQSILSMKTTSTLVCSFFLCFMYKYPWSQYVTFKCLERFPLTIYFFKCQMYQKPVILLFYIPTFLKTKTKSVFLVSRCYHYLS